MSDQELVNSPPDEVTEMQDIEPTPIEHRHRAGEPAGSPLSGSRSNRVFRLPSGWYFNTRERIALGPFASADKAESGIADFLAFLNEAPTHVRRLFGTARAATA